MSEQKFTGLNFDASTVAPSQALEPIPADWYTVMISDGEVKPTNDGTGTRFNFELTVMEGPFKGRKIFDGLNIKNNSAKAQEIAHQQLSAICHATQTIRIQNCQELFNKPFACKVGFEGARKDETTGQTYDARNTFKGCKPIGAQPSVGASPASNATPGPVAASGATPPWATKAPGAAAPVSTPAAAPIAPAPAKPAAPKSPAKPKKERKFFVFFSDTEMPLKTETEVADMLTKGMPPTNLLCLEGTEDWKEANTFGITSSAPAAATPAGAPVAPPWAR
jgi:hypothetical protein